MYQRHLSETSFNSADLVMVVIAKNMERQWDCLQHRTNHDKEYINRANSCSELSYHLPCEIYCPRCC